MGWIQK